MTDADHFNRISTGSCKFLTEEIVGAQISNFAPKFAPNSVLQLVRKLGIN